MTTPLIAAVLIVKNEGHNLRGCLQSVADWVDEIVILDSGSSDDTAMIAAEFNARYLIDADWPGFGIQRQRAQQHVTATWCLWLDADERVTPALKASVQQVCSQPAGRTVYSIPRLNWVFGRYIRHSGWYPDRVWRLYPTALTQYNDALVHEKVILDASMHTAPLAGDLIHYPYQDLEHYLIKSARYAKAWADGRIARGKKGSLLTGALHALGCFFRMYILRLGFLDGKAGLLLALLSTHSTFVKYADLWIRTRTPRRSVQ